MPKKPLNVTTIRLSVDDKARIEAIAAIEDSSTSRIIRTAIKKYINEYKGNLTTENKSGNTP